MQDNVGDSLLAQFRLQRRLNTSLIDLDKRTENLEAKMEEMLSEPPQMLETNNKQVSKAEIQLNSDRIVIPLDGKVSGMRRGTREYYP